MSQHHRLDRRAFLKSAGVTAVAGAVGAKSASATPATNVPYTPLSQTYDFDEVYDRVGTNCSKWDNAIAAFGDDIEVAMGIADMDFRAAPCVTRALAERGTHENWGYLRRPESYRQAILDWNKRRYDLEIDRNTLVWCTGVHAGIIAALQTFAPPGSRVLLTTPAYNGFYSDLRFTRTVPEDSPMTLVDGHYSIDFDDFELLARRANGSMRDSQSLFDQLLAFGKEEDRFGLIHADLLPDNVLVHEGSPMIIDFDDSGFSWNLYDLATLLNDQVAEDSWEETRDSWLEGYRRVIALPDSHLAHLPALIMARHLISLGWVHTRSETLTAYEFTEPVIELALFWSDRYLGS